MRESQAVLLRAEHLAYIMVLVKQNSHKSVTDTFNTKFGSSSNVFIDPLKPDLNFTVSF